MDAGTSLVKVNHMFFRCAIALVSALFLLPGVVLAGEPPTGHWQGSYSCRGVSQTATVDIWPDASAPNGLRGRFAFSPEAGGNTPSGSYFVTLESLTGGWKLVPEQWESQPDGYVMVAFSVYYTLNRLGGLVEDQICMGSPRAISLAYAGESNFEAVAAAPDVEPSAGPSAPNGYEQPDYMRRAAEERKAQNRANCERAAQGANVYCNPNPY